MKETFFSIVIPVYKVEGYLERCVDSVLAQSYQSFELILVDDGSPDNCPKICDAYLQKDTRIKVIHQVNKGLSAARNTGTRNASGEYIIYIDSDDYWESDSALSEINRCISLNHSDLILFPFKKHDLRTGISITINTNYNSDFLAESDMESSMAYLFENNLFPGSAWVVCVKLNIIKEKNVYFTEGIKAEDFDWLIHLFLNIKTISSINLPFYVYNINRCGSITNVADIRSIESLLFIIDKWYKPLLDRGHKYLLNHLAYIYITIFATYGLLPRDLKRTIDYQIEKRRFILQYAFTKRNKYLALLLKILGFRLFSLGVRIYRKK